MDKFETLASLSSAQRDSVGGKELKKHQEKSLHGFFLITRQLCIVVLYLAPGNKSTKLLITFGWTYTSPASVGRLIGTRLRERSPTHALLIGAVTTSANTKEVDPGSPSALRRGGRLTSATDQ